MNRLTTLLTLACMLFGFATVSAQYATVNYDYERNYFGENQPLPAEQSLLFTGTTPPNIDLVEINILKSDAPPGDDPKATGIWKRPFNRTDNTFNVPVNYRLKSNKSYDIEIQFFRKLNEAEKEAAYEQVIQNLNAYLNQSFEVKKRGIGLVKKSRQMIRDMNTIVHTGLAQYRNFTLSTFPGFSDIVRQKLDNLEQVNLKKAKLLYEGQDEDAMRRQYRKDLTTELQTLVASEVQYLFNHDMALLTDSRYIDDYSTENKPGFFTINVGYGGVYLDGKLDNIDAFGSGGYAGVGFPLSQSSIAPKFLRNASLSVGMFFQNFENEAGDAVTGPVFNRPIYASLDYRLFQFVSINVGASLLEEKNTGPEDGNNIFFRPFVGLSARFNVSLSLAK